MDPPLLKLVIVQGPREGEAFEYKSGSTIRIGRVVKGNNLTIKDAGISSKHIQIVSESGKWLLQDIGSSNGTILNSAAVPPDTPFELCNGDVIKLGEFTSILIEFHEQDQPCKLRRNPRRQGRDLDAVGLAGENQGGRGRVLKENAENENVKKLPRKGRVLKSEIIEDLDKMGNLDNQAEKRVNSRVTRSRNIELVEDLSLDCGKAGIHPKNRRGRGNKRKNLQEEPPESSQIDAVDTKESHLEEEARIEEEDKENLDNLRLGGDCKGTVNGSGHKLRNADEFEVKEGTGKVEEDPNCEAKENSDKVGNEDNCDSLENCDRVDKESRSGEKIDERVGVDLEKMTLGEWFEYMEVNLPKQIIDSTEEMIEGMRRKAERVRDYIIEQKGKMPVAVD